VAVRGLLVGAQATQDGMGHVKFSDREPRSEVSDAPTQMRQNLLTEPTRFGAMVGRSAPMRALFATLDKAAASDATVLLEGETGTGKEASAEAIHRSSGRRDGPFVVIDCGAIPAQLLESELFGSERGAYTGAVATRAGAFEAASGGTIFLDEIGELHLDLQPKILRALERRQVKRVGSTEYRPVDMRVVAATNRSLRAEVEARRFRSDLYYRLAVVRIKLPPLRERIADLPLLVEHMLTSLGVADDPGSAAYRDPEFSQRLLRFPWPGNIRQLRNHVERCVALGDPNLPPALETCPPPPDSAPELQIDSSEPLRVARERFVSHFERSYLEAVLARNENNVAAAARAAGVDRIHFYRLLWKHGVRDHKSTSGSDEDPSVDETGARRRRSE
jgi:transcriptional regulator with PAS, ATPase and Fis domain